MDAIVIAIPVGTYFAVAKRTLENGKHVLVEKPMTQTVAQSEELIEIARKDGRVLMVDHTFIHTGAVRKMKEIMEVGVLGDLYYFVLWDLAPHDLSILTHLIKQPPKYVSAVGSTHTVNRPADVTCMTVHFENDLMTHFHVNLLSPVKIRQTLIGGSRRMLACDDMQPSERIRVHDRGVQVTTQGGVYNTLIDSRQGDMWAPKIEFRGALSAECQHFLKCIRFKKVPESSGESGFAVVRLLGASKSLAGGGEMIPV